MKKLVFLVLATAIAAPAVAADRSDPAARKPSKPHLICKRDETTATRVSRAVCKTAAEWAGTSVDTDQDQLGVLSRQSTTENIGGLPSPPGGPH